MPDRGLIPHRKGMDPMKVVITGAAGLLGRVVAETLAAEGMDIVPTDCLGGVVGNEEILVHDLRDPEPWPNLLENANAVVHCAAEPDNREPQSARHFTTNVEGTANLCRAAIAGRVRKFVYVSTIQVISSEGVPEEGPWEVPYLPLDGSCPPNPRNLYALSKATGEVLVREILAPEGVECQSLRFPWLVEPKAGALWGRTLKPFAEDERRAVVEQGFACLSLQDAARLIFSCLKASLPGHRIYYPAYSVVPPEEIPLYLGRYYEGVELRRPIDEIQSLVDLSTIEAETGWKPRDIPPPRPPEVRKSWPRRIIGRFRREIGRVRRAVGRPR
jgi:UDP-glucuronate 4-epimerase